MKNKGFTLIELLGVMIIISLLMILVFPSIINSVRTSSKKTDDLTLKLIYNASDIYISNHLNKFPKDNGNKYIINLDDLVSEHLLASPIKLSDSEEDLTNKKCVQVEYDGKYNYELKNVGECVQEIKIYTLESGNAGEYGAKYSVKVNDTDTFNFYVVGTNEDGTTNLILERNMCSDGTFATAENKCLVAWASKADYITAGGTESDYGSNGNNNKGPITAMAYLKTATDGWTNIKAYKEGTVYNDEGNHFTNFSYAGYRARLPLESEVAFAKTDDSNKFLYEYLAEYSSWNTSSYGTKPTNNIAGIYGYWLFSSYSSDVYYARLVYYRGWSHNAYVYNNSYYGIRPVITLKIK